MPGSYDVTLIASDAFTTISHTKKDYITIVNTPQADFIADKTKGITPFTVNFRDISTGNPTGWQWEFGDGATSTDQNPTHIYTTKGTSATNTFTVYPHRDQSQWGRYGKEDKLHHGNADADRRIHGGQPPGQSTIYCDNSVIYLQETRLHGVGIWGWHRLFRTESGT